MYIICKIVVLNRGKMHLWCFYGSIHHSPFTIRSVDCAMFSTRTASTRMAGEAEARPSDVTRHSLHVDPEQDPGCRFPPVRAALSTRHSPWQTFPSEDDTRTRRATRP
jgi:hypothetical protein